MKFPSIEKLGLRVIVGPSGKPEVSAEELEFTLKNLGVLYARIPIEGAWIQDISMDQNAIHTHKLRFLLVEDVKPLEVSLTRAQVYSVIRKKGVLTEYEGFGFERYINDICNDLGL